MHTIGKTKESYTRFVIRGKMLPKIRDFFFILMSHHPLWENQYMTNLSFKRENLAAP